MHQRKTRRTVSVHGPCTTPAKPMAGFAALHRLRLEITSAGRARMDPMQLTDAVRSSKVCPISSRPGPCDGHRFCVLGYDAKAVIVNDPNGARDRLSGVYGSRNGAGFSCSRRCVGRRWLVDGNDLDAFPPGMGWALIAEPPAV